MKFIRLLLTSLAVAVALVAVLVVGAIAPAVQTFVAQKALGDRPGLRGTLESMSAGFGEVDVEGLHLESDGAVLTLPSLKAKLPITTAALQRRILIRSVVAKGWTLDLSRASWPADSPAQALAAAATAQAVARVFRGVLIGWRLPFDGSLDGVDLEGDVLFAAPHGDAPEKVHVVITGGGLSAGHEGALAVEASASGPVPVLGGLAANCSVVVGMESPRTVNRVVVKASFPGGRGSRLEDLTLSAEVAAAPGAAEETYAVSLMRGSRQLLAVLGRFPEATRRLSGTWNADLRDVDLAALVTDRPLPTLSAAGNGRYDVDAGFTRVHALGNLKIVASRLGALAPPLDGLGTVTLIARFDLDHSGHAARIDGLRLSVSGDRLAADIQSLQPFVFDEGTGEMNALDPRGDWLDASIRGLPLAWLSGLTGGRTIAGGDATGEFVVRAADAGYSLRPKTALTVAGVSIRSGGRILGSGLDLSLLMEADYAPKGWQVRCAPLTVGSAGQRLATIEARAAKLEGSEQPVAVSGTWNADLDAMGSHDSIPALSWATGRSASGDFSASLGAERKMEGTLLVAGHAKGDSISASVRASISADGVVAFNAPIKIACGSTVSEVSAEGSWVGEAAGNWVDARLTGASVALDHVRLLAAPLEAIGGAPYSAVPGAEPPAPTGARDPIPFWGDWTGHVAVAFDRLRTGEGEFVNVGGVFDIDGGSIKMTGGRGGLGKHLLTNVEGSISFDKAAASPYSVKADAALNEIDAAQLFEARKPGLEPAFEGHFSVQGRLMGNGANLDDLASRTQIEFKLASTAGIIRLLKTNVAESIPEVSSPVSDTLGTVGYVVGSVFGVDKKNLSPGKSSVSKTGDAVLNFTYEVSEIGYDKVTVTAIWGPDGTIHIPEIELTSPEVHLKGSGQITHVKGLPFADQPLSAELQFGARGGLADLSLAAGLLSLRKDALGYAILNDPIRLIGTLEHIDNSPWTELLVKAATRKQDGGKKGG